MPDDAPTSEAQAPIDRDLVGRWIRNAFESAPNEYINVIGGPVGSMFEFTGAGVLIVRNADGSSRREQYMVTCDTAKQPHWLDMFHAKFSKDIRCEALYHVAGDELVIVSAQSGQPRPNSLDRSINTAWITQRLKRAPLARNRAGRAAKRDA